MKKSSALLLALLITAAVAQEKKQIIPAGAEIAHKTTHRLEIPAKGGGMGICSATAIGPHQLLTATHCEINAQVVGGKQIFKLDGKPIFGSHVERDENDHSIITVDSTFKDFACLSLSGLKQSEHVYLWGEPNGMEDMYREGVVSGKDGDAILIDLNGYFGDSGAGIFNLKGEVVGVISIISHESSSKGPSLKFMGAFALAFKPAQYESGLLCKSVI